MSAKECDWCGNEGHAETDCPALEPNPVKASCIHLTNCDCASLRVERDRLTAENAELELDNGDLLHRAIRAEAERDDAQAELRSLRAAVARIKRLEQQQYDGDGDPADLEVDLEAAVDVLNDMVPSDNSWQKE